MGKYRILKTEGRAKRAEFETVHGTIQTPVFMNVGTAAAIKGAVATEDLERIGTQVELSNTYISMCVRVMKWLRSWEACINLWCGISRS